MVDCYAALFCSLSLHCGETGVSVHLRREPEGGEAERGESGGRKEK